MSDRADQDPQKRRWRLGIGIALALFAFARLRGQLAPYVALHQWLADVGVPADVRNLDHTLWLVVGALLGARVAWGHGRVGHGLGLDGRMSTALRFALLAGLPMFVQAAVASPDPGWDAGLLRGVVLAPFVEELFFRAALVGIAVRGGHLPFWPAAVLAGLLFGSVHVPWSSQFGVGHLGVLAATTAGGIWYAWLLRAFDWNLWTTILLHAVMNAAWALFAVADDAAGGLWPNVGRGLTIALGTVLALRWRRRTAALEPEVAREEANR